MKLSAYPTLPFPVTTWRMRDELPNETMFQNPAHARIAIRDWAHDFNPNRSLSALGYETPEAFAKHLIFATDCHTAPNGILTQ